MNLPKFNPFAEVPIPGPLAKLMMKDFPSILITRTVEYQPDDYLQYCKENNLTPDKDDFYEFIESWVNEDFRTAFTDHKVEFIYD